MEKQNLQNQVAIVTGGGTGIGQSIAVDLATKGAKVMVLGRNLKSLQETQNLIEEQGGYVECHVADVTDKAGIKKVVEDIHSRFGQIHILVCNAGNRTEPKFATSMTDLEFEDVIKTNITGTLNCVQICADKMKENKYGRIILMSSLAAVFGLVGQINYATVKTGLVGMTYTLAKELGPHGITVNCLQPGIIETTMTEGPLQLAREAFEKATPVQRIGQPKDVAHATTFLCMPESSFITGVILKIDGGFILNSGMDQLIMQICEHNENNQ